MKTFNGLVVLLFILLITNVQLRPQHQIKSGVLANGGTSANNETIRVVGTIGQSVIGRNNNQTHIMKSGFWEQTIGLITDISIDENSQPEEYYLYQNYPNPFNPSTTISFSLPAVDFITFKIYDVLGGEVATLVNEEKPAGIYKIDLDGSKLSSGVYFYTIITNNFTSSRKMILIK